MKVYVITSGKYSDYGIETVALDEKEAKMKCAALNSASNLPYYYKCRIEEYDTEDFKVSTNEDIKLMFVLIVSKDGDWESFSDGTPIIAKESIEVKFCGQENSNIKCHAILPDGTTKEQAKKIMLDHVAKFKAEKAGV